MGVRLSESEPFYTPDPAMFGNRDAFRMFTNYAAELEQAGLADRFPQDAATRHEDRRRRGAAGPAPLRSIAALGVSRSRL